MENVELFCILTALVLVITRMILSYLREIDQKKGLPINPKEYTIGGLIKLILLDIFNAIKNIFKGEKRSGKKKS